MPFWMWRIDGGAEWGTIATANRAIIQWTLQI